MALPMLGTTLGGPRCGHSPCHGCVRGRWLRPLLEGLCPLVPYCPVGVVGGCGCPAKDWGGLLALLAALCVQWVAADADIRGASPVMRLRARMQILVKTLTGKYP